MTHNATPDTGMPPGRPQIPHSAPPSTSQQGSQHSYFDDAQALLTGTLLFAVAITLFQKAGMLTGGTAGLNFLLHYATGLSFGLLYFLVNIPFYFFALRAMGWVFTVKTFIAVALLSLYSEWVPQLIRIDYIDPLFAAFFGGLLAGAGLLMLIRHRASLGGLGVLSIWLQDTRGWRAGHVQLAADALIVLCAFLVVDGYAVLLTGVGAATLNLVLAINHKPGRYAAY